MDDKVTDSMTPNTPCGHGVCFKYEYCLQWGNCTALFKRRRQAPKAESQSAKELARHLNGTAKDIGEAWECEESQLDEYSEMSKLEEEIVKQQAALIESAFAAQRQAGREEAAQIVDALRHERTMTDQEDNAYAEACQDAASEIRSVKAQEKAKPDVGKGE